MKVLVVGPESSGSRWVSKICAFLLKVKGWEKWDADRRATINDGEHIVTHLSWPYGPRFDFPSLAAYKGYKIVITMRDQNVMLRSMVKHHDKNKRRAKSNQKHALELASEALLDDDYDTFLLNYESAVAIPKAVVGTLSEWLTGKKYLSPIPEKLAPKDANFKYLN